MNTIDQSSNLSDALQRSSATHAQAERRKIERDRLRQKRRDPVYAANERAANAARMRKWRERTRRRPSRHGGTVAEARV